MEPRSRKVTTVCSGVAAAASVVAHPIPAADDLVVVPVHYYLCIKMARQRRFSIWKLPWRSIQRIIWYGAGARFVVNFSLGMVPLVGALSNCVTAVALTEFLAHYIDDTISHPERPPREVTMAGMKALFLDAIRRSKKDSEPEPEPASGSEAPPAQEATSRG